MRCALHSISCREETGERPEHPSHQLRHEPPALVLRINQSLQRSNRQRILRIQVVPHSLKPIAGKICRVNSLPPTANIASVNLPICFINAAPLPLELGFAAQSMTCSARMRCFRQRQCEGQPLHAPQSHRHANRRTNGNWPNSDAVPEYFQVDVARFGHRMIGRQPERFLQQLRDLRLVSNCRRSKGWR